MLHAPVHLLTFGVKTHLRFILGALAIGVFAGCATTNTTSTETTREKRERVADAPVGTRIKKKRSRDMSPVSGVSGSAREIDRVQAAAAMSDAVNTNR